MVLSQMPANEPVSHRRGSHAVSSLKHGLAQCIQSLKSDGVRLWLPMAITLAGTIAMIISSHYLISSMMQSSTVIGSQSSIHQSGQFFATDPYGSSGAGKDGAAYASYKNHPAERGGGAPEPVKINVYKLDSSKADFRGKLLYSTLAPVDELGSFEVPGDVSKPYLLEVDHP